MKEDIQQLPGFSLMLGKFCCCFVSVVNLHSVNEGLREIQNHYNKSERNPIYKISKNKTEESSKIKKKQDKAYHVCRIRIICQAVENISSISY